MKLDGGNTVNKVIIDRKTNECYYLSYCMKLEEYRSPLLIKHVQ